MFNISRKQPWYMEYNSVTKQGVLSKQHLKYLSKYKDCEHFTKTFAKHVGELFILNTPKLELWVCINKMMEDAVLPIKQE